MATELKLPHDQRWADPILEAQPDLAAFDCDGTLWSVDSGIGFLEWELERATVSPDAAAKVRAQYADYVAGSVSEAAMSGYLATMHEGIPIDALRSAAEEYVDTHVRPALLGLPPERVLATAAAVEGGIVSGRLQRVPNGPGKCAALQGVVGAVPDAAFGNSRWDVEMLAYARRAYAVHPTPELAAVASQRGCHVVYPR
jgi:phosphoserine phosphatase